MAGKTTGRPVHVFNVDEALVRVLAEQNIEPFQFGFEADTEPFTLIDARELDVFAVSQVTANPTPGDIIRLLLSPEDRKRLGKLMQEGKARLTVGATQALFEAYRDHYKLATGEDPFAGTSLQGW